jgi:hypothetical protein
VRTPQQTSNVDAFSTCTGQEGRNRCSVFGYTFVPVSTPIDKANFVVRFETRDDFSETGEIGDPINEEVHVVSLGPRSTLGTMRVDFGH